MSDAAAMEEKCNLKKEKACSLRRHVSVSPRFWILKKKYGRDYSWHADTPETAKKLSWILMIRCQTSSQLLL